MRNIGRGILERIVNIVRQHASVAEEDVGNAPIEILGLNTRATNSLQRANVSQVRDLVRRSQDDLLRVPNLGRGTLKHICAALSQHGLKLSEKTHSDEIVQGDENKPLNLEAPVHVLGLSVRASNGLRRLGVKSVEDLVRCNEADLLRIPNMGHGTVKHVTSVLHKYGLKLGKTRDGDARALLGTSAKLVEMPKPPNLGEVLGKLRVPGRTWAVLEGRFGVGRRLTLRSLADRIGVTRERVRQIEKAGVSVLNARLNQLAPGLSEIEKLLEDRVARVVDTDVVHLESEIRDASKSLLSSEDVRGLLVVLRALTSAGSAEATWPILSFRACMLPPTIEKHTRVRKNLEEAAATARERTRQWTYRELALHVLRKEQGPLHWREIAERCEGLGKRRNFSATSCFNQMQADTEQFVRVGQGTYALVEWGLDRQETLNDLIASFLFESGKCLAYGEIFQRAVARQSAKPSSIQMTLDLHPRFYRSVSGRFGLRAWLPAREMQTLRTRRELVEAEDSERRVSNAEARGYNVARMVSEDRKRCC